MTPGTERRVRDSFARQAMMKTLGARLGALAPGRVEVVAPITDRLRQQHGFAHAGLAFALGDSAAGYSALSVMPEDHEVLTSEMKIHLLAPAQGDALVARGRVIRPGRRLVIVQADIFAQKDGAETHVALLTGTMIPVPSPA